SMSARSRAAFLAAFPFAVLLSVSAHAAMVGRVSVTEVAPEETSRAQIVRDTLEGRYAALPGQRFADTRVVSLRPRAGDPTRFDVTIYDYAAESGFELVMDSWGNELERTPLPMQPDLTPSEL